MHCATIEYAQRFGIYNGYCTILVIPTNQSKFCKQLRWWHCRRAEGWLSMVMLQMCLLYRFTTSKIRPTKLIFATVRRCRRRFTFKWFPPTSHDAKRTYATPTVYTSSQWRLCNWTAVELACWLQCHIYMHAKSAAPRVMTASNVIATTTATWAQLLTPNIGSLLK